MVGGGFFQMSDTLNTPGYEIPPEMQSQVAITTLDKIYNWGRRSSIWPMMFGLAVVLLK
jgi:NADH-quinone oxidoreductase subunit B